MDETISEDKMRADNKTIGFIGLCVIVIGLLFLIIIMRQTHETLIAEKDTIIIQKNGQLNDITRYNVEMQSELETAKEDFLAIEARLQIAEENNERLQGVILTLESENAELRQNATTYRTELDLLSRLLMAEAGGSSLEDIQLCGTVVMNRLEDPRFPDTLYEVVYQEGQYAPTWNGAINNTPSERCIEVAQNLLLGERYAPENVVWQSQKKQGKGVYALVGVHYYCY